MVLVRVALVSLSPQIATWYLRLEAISRSRECRQRGLGCSSFANPFKVAKFGLDDDRHLQSALRILSRLRLLCHCGAQQTCHADILISAYSSAFPDAFDWNDVPASPPPTSDQLNHLAELRDEHDSSEGSTADGGSRPSESGWTGTGRPMQVGIGFSVRDFCDGQTLASPDRWPPALPSVRHLEGSCGSGQKVLRTFRDNEAPDGSGTRTRQGIPFLKDEVVSVLSSRGLKLNRASPSLRGSRHAAGNLCPWSEGRIGNEDAETSPPLYRPKRRWRPDSQRDPTNWQQEEEEQSGFPWRQNYASLVGFADKVEAVLQAGRRQVLKFTEAEARVRFLDLGVASMGAQRKDKPTGVVSARVLFDGTRGLAVSTRTRFRDPERSPIATDLKRAMKERGQPTFALTADVSEAHRQVPVHPSDWMFLGCQVAKGSTVYVVTVGIFGITSTSFYWNRVGEATGRISQYVVGDSAATWRSWWRRVQLCLDDILHYLFHCGCPFVLE